MFSYPSLHQASRVSLLLSLLLLAITTSAFAWSNAPADVEVWRPISPSDLALKAPLVEPDADAEAIFWDIRVDDADNDLVLSNYIRIKVFTERGREKASRVEIPFLNGIKITDIAARVIKPDGSVVELRNEDVIEKTVVQVSGLKLRTKSLVFPGVEPGAIIEYKWKEVIYRAGANNMRLQFQREIPIQSVTYHIKPAVWSSSFEVYPFNMPRPEFQQEKDGFEYITVTKMPSFHPEPFMPPEENVRSWALVKYHSDRRPLLKYEEMAKDFNYYWQSSLKVDDDIKRKSAEIVAGATTPEEKLEKIFVFCRTNIKNTDDKTLGFTSEQIEKLKENKKPADTLKRGVGSALDINLLFAALANAAGLEARTALLPDRSQRFFNRTLLIPGALSSSIIAVRVGEAWKFYNPGVRYNNTGMLLWQVEGVDALIVDKTPTWTMTPISPPEKSKEIRGATLSLDENGTLEGEVTVEYTGHLAIWKKVLNDDDSPNQREENLKASVKARLSSAELSNIVIENVTDPSKPFIYKYHVKIPEYAQRTGKRLFLQPGFFQKGIAAVFASSKRQHEIYFSYPWSEEDKVTIALPKGYTLDTPEVPAPIRAGRVCQYAVKLAVDKEQSAIVYSRSFLFGNDQLLLFPAEGYGDIKRLFDTISKSDNNTVAIRQSAPVN